MTIAVVVYAANIQDRDGAKLLLDRIRDSFRRIRLIWAGGGYAGKLVQWVSALRHGYRRFPLRYSPLFWGAVFPLGMYTACSHRLAGLTAVPLIATIPKGLLYVAMAAWIVAFAGKVHGILANVREAKPSTCR